MIAGQSLWIPSQAFVQQLKANGSITSGETVASPVWTEAKKRMQVNPELANEAGITVGLQGQRKSSRRRSKRACS